MGQEHERLGHEAGVGDGVMGSLDLLDPAQSVIDQDVAGLLRHLAVAFALQDGLVVALRLVEMAADPLQVLLDELLQLGNDGAGRAREGGRHKGIEFTREPSHFGLVGSSFRPGRIGDDWGKILAGSAPRVKLPLSVYLYRDTIKNSSHLSQAWARSRQ